MTDRTARALIVEGDYSSRGAVAAVRALAAAGWTVGVASARPKGLAAASRFCSAAHLIPSRATGVDAFIAGVASVVRDGGYEVVFPAGDGETLALSEHRHDVGAVVPYGPRAGVARAFDKVGLTEAAGNAGVATPRLAPADPGTASTFGVPLVVKGKVHWDPLAGGPTEGMDAVRAATVADAEARADALRRQGGEPLFQEIVEGDLVAYEAVRASDGQIVAEVQQRALRIFPGPAGISCRAVTEPVDPNLAGSVARLLVELEWCGLAQVQFLAPPAGPPRLIDLNGRIYGSLALAAAAGVNLMAAWAAGATNRSCPSPAAARPGVMYQWLTADLRQARRDGLRGVLSAMAVAPRAVHSIWSGRDPGPAVRFVSSRMGRS